MGTYKGKLTDAPSDNIYQINREFTYGTDIVQDVSNFTAVKSALDTKNSLFSSTNNVPAALQSNLLAYIRSGGINTQAAQDLDNPLYKNVRNSWIDANTMINSYQNLTKSMTSALKEYNGLTAAQSGAITSMRDATSSLQVLNNTLKQSQQDLDIATSRQESVTKSKVNQSYTQGFAGNIGFTRPLKPTSVALLMGLGFFIFFVTCLILKDYFTISADIAAQFFSMNEIVEHLSSNTARSVTIGVVATFIVYAAALYVYFYVYNK
jgi:hypothetical protein